MNNLALILKAASEDKTEIGYDEKCIGCKHVNNCILKATDGSILCTLSNEEKIKCI